MLREYYESDSDCSEEKHVIEPGAPNRCLGAFRLFCPEVLADERRGRVTQPPRRQDDEYYDSDCDGVPGDGGRAEKAHDAHEPNPAGLGYGELQNSRERQPEEPKKNFPIRANVATEQPDALRAVP